MVTEVQRLHQLCEQARYGRSILIDACLSKSRACWIKAQIVPELCKLIEEKVLFSEGVPAVILSKSVELLFFIDKAIN